MLRAISFALPLIFWAIACRAGDDPGCANAMTQPEMNRCAANEYTRADAALNKVYQALLATLDAPRRQRLIETERAWISFRDAHCHFETAQSEGGSMHSLLYDVCLTDLTKKRTEELQASLDCERGVGKCND